MYVFSEHESKFKICLCRLEPLSNMICQRRETYTIENMVSTPQKAVHNYRESSEKGYQACQECVTSKLKREIGRTQATFTET